MIGLNIVLTISSCVIASIGTLGSEANHQYLTVSSKGKASIKLTHWMGIYSLQETPVNGFPVWKKQGEDQYLYVAALPKLLGYPVEMYWAIGPDTASATAEMYLPDDNPTPKTPINTHGWEYDNGGEWEIDGTIRVDVYIDANGCDSGFFKSSENEFGCTPCFCFNHTDDCERAREYTKAQIMSDFHRGSDSWTTEIGEELVDIRFNDIAGMINTIPEQVENSQNTPVYFLAPSKFLGDQRNSYNQLLKFRLKVLSSQIDIIPSSKDIMIEGQETTITLMVTAQGNPTPSDELQDYAFRLQESMEWSPSLTSKEFMSLLADIKSIKIRGTYSIDGIGFLDDVKLETAEVSGNGAPATWIEQCGCPMGYKGHSCELCQTGYFHENSRSPFASCIGFKLFY